MKKNGWKGFCKKLYKYRVFLLMLAPAVIYTLIFSYYPMTGIVMAFKKYSYAGGIWGSPWNGFDNFKFFFKSGHIELAELAVTDGHIHHDAAAHGVVKILPDEG